MKNRIKNCLGILAVAAVWALFIVLVMCSCNSSRHLQQQSTHTDSTVVQHHDSVAVSSSRTEERQGNEHIMEMLFGMQQSIDAKGQPIINTYPTSLRVIDRSGTEKISAGKDSVHKSSDDTAHKEVAKTDIDKSSKTEVFPMWWMAAAFGIGILTRFLKIQV